ncbi:uncharacterized protein TRAVEDRAFT_61154 [Trametes versicolor FP-101664 SS1]|uniref:uncharacterized protein n=1 Tax=Trametes versicolor (strain FP-101664) TaxID=717944 RepID=UPI0004624968|nr:uncharacterized protein TRAVEDRAFT_61154 [Trametes versicolor FP-101664 SS1]EIW52882.1 hypothetical protein TRAVEDRAFT_61154 [Trametes versicolor FP-101664 SS1]
MCEEREVALHGKGAFPRERRLQLYSAFERRDAPACCPAHHDLLPDAARSSGGSTHASSTR